MAFVVFLMACYGVRICLLREDGGNGPDALLRLSVGSYNRQQEWPCELLVFPQSGERGVGCPFPGLFVTLLSSGHDTTVIL